MKGQYLLTFLLTGACIPLVISRHDYQNDYHEYYHYKHHKVSSTTEALSTQGDDSSEEIESSSDGSHRTKVNINETVQHGGGPPPNPIQYTFMVRIGIIVASVVAFICILGCVLCCCPSCCRGKQTQGFIVANTREEQADQLQQPISSQYPQQPVAAQHFPPNYSQDQPQQFPPQYTQEPVQQYPPQYMQQPIHQQPHYSPAHPQNQYSPSHPQNQYSPSHPQNQYSPAHPQNQYSPTAPQYYNPPEAPPPYDTSLAPKY